MLKDTFKKLLSALVIYFVLAAAVEFTIGWGQNGGWLFVTVLAVIMALADVFILQPLKRWVINKMNKSRQTPQ